MKHFYKKNPNNFFSFFDLKKSAGKKITLSMGLLFLFNLEVSAQSNVSYNLNSIPVNGFNNSAFGYQAFKLNTTGTDNSAFGYQALYNNTSGIGNTALGFKTLYLNTTGTKNTANGFQTLYSNTTGYNNTGNGHEVLVYNTTGFYNTANGFHALYFNISGSTNTANGVQALYTNTIGVNNTGNGVNALFSNNTGSGNVATGVNTLYTNTTGNNNTGLGSYADVTSGNLTNATAIGYNAKVNASNTIQLGDANVTQIFAGVSNTAKLFAGSCVLGTISTPIGYKLYVEQGILTEKVKVALKSSANWADHVFEEDYQLSKLEDVEQFITKNKHLPNVPSAAEVVKEGIDLGKMDAKLLEKIEELTLYMIELNKKVVKVEAENEILKTAIVNIHKR